MSFFQSNVDEIDKVYDKLEAIEKTFGFYGVVITIVMGFLTILAAIYVKNFIKNYTKSIFNQSLAKTQANLLDKIGKKLISQKGEIEKEITGLKGEIDKEVSQIQSNLNLIFNQRNNFLNLKREALIDFYTKVLRWFNKSGHKNNINLNSDEKKKLSKTTSSI